MSFHDQYSGKAGRVWNHVIGDRKKRISLYRDFLGNLLHQHGCARILDAACGTGIDSVWLVEEGFNVTSSDLSLGMLIHAMKERWNRRKEPGFDEWVIEQSNWLTLTADIKKPDGVGFDAIICLGHSFAHLPAPRGDTTNQIRALKNFYEMLKPGGYLLVDHRNYSLIINQLDKQVPKTSYLFESDRIKKVTTSLLYVDSKPELLMMDWQLDLTGLEDMPDTDEDRQRAEQGYDFRTVLYPLMLEPFSELLKAVFGSEAEYIIFADHKPIGEIENPVYYQHFIRKPI